MFVVGEILVHGVMVYAQLFIDRQDLRLQSAHSFEGHGPRTPLNPNPEP